MKEVVYLNEDSESIIYLSDRDKRLKKLFSMIGSISYKPYDDSYDFLVSQIIGQMLANKVAIVLRKRLRDKCDGKITIEKVNQLSDFEIKSIGISEKKVFYIRELTAYCKNNSDLIQKLDDYDDESVIKILTTVPGIGNWTAKMYLIFVMNRQNVLPYEDGAFIQGYNWLYKANTSSVSDIKKKCKKWNPYSSIAARYLYKSVDLGLTKKTFHLYLDYNND